MNMPYRLFGGALVEAALLAAVTTVVVGLIGTNVLPRRGRVITVDCDSAGQGFRL